MQVQRELEVSFDKGIRAELRWIRIALDRTPDAAFLIGADGRFIYVNETACRSLGYERTELLEMSISDVDAKIPSSAWEQIWRGFKMRGAHNVESQHRPKSGRTFPVELAINYFEFGGKGYAAFVARDITERKQSEERLRQSEERLELALRGAQLGMWDWDLKTDELLLHELWAKMLGYELHDLVPHRTAWQRLVHPDDKEAMLAALGAHLAGDAPLYESLHRLRAKSGEWRWIQDRGMVSKQDASGKPLRITGIQLDVTERRTLDEERLHRLQRVQRHQSAILALATDEAAAGGHFADAARTITKAVARAVDVERSSIWLLSDDHRTLRCAELYQRSSDSYDGGTELQVRDYPRYFAALDSGRAITAELARKDPRTSELAEIYLEPLGISSTIDACVRLHGKPVGVVRLEHVGEAREWRADETTFAGEVADQVAQALANQERRRLEARMQQAQKLESLGILAGGIAHDFNNLLMAMLGNADLALSELPMTSPARSYLQDIEAASRRAADLCRQMLAYSGRGRFVVEILDLHAVIEEMTHMLEVAISKKIVLKYDFADRLPLVEVDATQVRQVLMNLITNAAEAIGDATGFVSIRTGAMCCDQGYLRQTYFDDQLPGGSYTFFEVSDTGCGMNEETLARVFDPFFTTKFTGRGLGMAAVLGIVRGHRGAIKVSSRPGAGSTFRVLLPARALEDNAVESAEDDEGASWKGEGTVLLIDDEETVRTIGKRMLEKLGFSVLTAEDGRRGLEVFRDHCEHIACVLLDLTMPHMDGESCHRELRQMRGDVRVILSSGFDERQATHRFADVGLAGFVQKPYQLTTLRASMKRALEGSVTSRDLGAD